MGYFTTAFVLFVLFVIYKQTRYWLRWRALAQWGSEQGAVLAPAVPNILPGGVERYKIMFTGLKGIDFLEDIIHERHRTMKCNTYRVHNVFNSSLVTTADPENIQAVLATKFHDYDLGPSRKDNFYQMLGNGIFTAEGEAWAHYRRQLKPQFTRDQVSDLEAAARHLDILFKVLPEENASGWVEEVDLLPLIYNFTMDVSTEFLFGQSCDSQSTSLHALDSSNTTAEQENKDFAEAMKYAQDYIAWRIRLRGLYWTQNSKKFQWACNTVKAFADKFVQIALNPQYKKPASAEGKFVLLDALLEETKDPIELRDQILHILLAGRDTTSALMCWAFLLLSRSPSDFNNLRTAVLAQFGTELNPKAELTFESLKACKPVTHVLYEAMRLYPLLPVNGRVALRDTILPVGGGPDLKQPVYVKKGEMVGWCTYVLHRRADIWGEDATEFRPSRWEGRKLGWEFIPFSGGPRVCLGQQYALNEASFVLVKFLQRYDKIEALDMTSKLVKGMTLTLTPAHGVKVKLHRATE